MTQFAGQGFKYTPPGGGGDGSLWYAPTGAAAPPATLPVASGARALAAGNAALADGVDAIAFGDGARAAGARSIGIGDSAQALAADCVAIGTSSSAGQNSCFALGNAVTATGGASAVAIGVSSQATAGESVAIGSSVSATSNNAVVVGVQASATGGNAVAIGPLGAASGIASVALGSATADTTGGVALPGANTFNDWELQSVNSTGARVMRCISGGYTVNAALTTVGTYLLPNNAACAFSGECAAYRTAGAGTVGDSASWTISGLVKQVGGAYTLIGAVVGTAGAPTFNDAGAAPWVLAAAVSGASLVVQATGEAGETIHFETRLTFTTTN